MRRGNSTEGAGVRCALLCVVVLLATTTISRAALLFDDAFATNAQDAGWVEVESQLRRIGHGPNGVVLQSLGTQHYILRRFDLSGGRNVTLGLEASDGGSFEGDEYFAIELDRGDGAGFVEVYRDQTEISVSPVSGIALGADEACDVLIKVLGVSNAETYYLRRLQLEGDGIVRAATNTVLLHEPFDAQGDWLISGSPVTFTGGYVQLQNNSAVTLPFDTTGHDWITVDARGTGLGDFEGPDNLFVEVAWGTNAFVTLETDIAFGSTNWVSPTMLFPAGAWTNETTRLRLRGDTNGEWYRIDELTIRGLPLPPPIPQGSVLYIQ